MKECGSRFLKLEDTGTSEEMGRLDVSLSNTSDDCSWVCAKPRVATDSETDITPCVMFDEDQCAGVTRTLSFE